MYKILNTRLAANIAFITAFFSKLIILYNYNAIGYDESMQVAGAVNILKGHGNSLPRVNVMDFTHVQYTTITEWPPLYSYLLVPFLKVTNFNIELSCYLVDVISIMVFIFFLRELIKQMSVPYIFQFFFLIYFAFYVRNYFTSSFPTDLLAAGFFMGALNFFLLYLKNSDIRQLLLMILFILLASYTRYMYMPLAFIFPLMLIWNGFIKKNLSYVMTAAIVSITCLVFLTPLILQNFWISDKPNVYWSRGIFLNNLLPLSPFFLDSIIDKEFFIYQFSNITHINYRLVLLFLIIINYLILALTLGYFVRQLLSVKGDLFEKDSWKNFFFAGGILSIGIIFLLMYMSASSNFETKFGDIHWTYVSENRYFIFVQVFLLLVITFLVFSESIKYRITKAIFKIFLFSLFTVEVSHGVYILLKSTTKEGGSFKKKADLTARRNFVNEIVNKSRDQNYEPVIFSFGYYFMALASLNDIKLCTDFEKFDEKAVKLDKPTQLLFITYNGPAKAYYRSFILKHQFQYIQGLDSIRMYSKKMEPNE